jgi:hypothetical protein
MTRTFPALRVLAIVALAVVSRPGVAPETPWSCPSASPIKGYLAQSGARVYFLPGTPFYDEASPERCYASEDEARSDGADPVGDGRPRPGRDDRA